MRSFLLLFSKYLQPKPFQRVDRDQTLETLLHARTPTKRWKVKQEAAICLLKFSSQGTYVSVEASKKNTYFLSYVATP